MSSTKNIIKIWNKLKLAEYLNKEDRPILLQIEKELKNYTIMQVSDEALLYVWNDLTSYCGGKYVETENSLTWFSDLYLYKDDYYECRWYIRSSESLPDTIFIFTKKQWTQLELFND